MRVSDRYRVDDHVFVVGYGEDPVPLLVVAG
jgi:hypothetical protein